MVRYIEELYSAREVADRSLPRTGAEELAAGSDRSAGRKDGAEVDFVRGEEAEAAARAVVEVGGDLVAEGLGQMAEGGPLGEILADQAVGIFVGAALPGVVRSGEVDGGAELTFEGLVAVEFDAVVGSDGADLMGLVGE